MKEIIISGGSDDLIEVSGALRDEFGVYGDPGEMGTLVLSTKEDGVVAKVKAYYQGFWSFAFIGTVDEDGDYDVTMPEGWKVEVKAIGHRGGNIAQYSMSLHIHVPDGCKVSIGLEEE